jgi:hypothetical protein
MKKKTPKRGRKAQASGKMGEDISEGLMMPYVDVIDYNDFKYKDLFPGPYPFMDPICLRQYPSTHPFRRGGSNRKGRNDFMWFAEKEDISLQIKNQDSNGTTDEKLQCVFDIARRNLLFTPYNRFVLVLLGTYWESRTGAVEYARTKLAPRMIDDWESFSGVVKVDIAHGPIEFAALLKKLREEGVI